MMPPLAQTALVLLQGGTLALALAGAATAIAAAVAVPLALVARSGRQAAAALGVLSWLARATPPLILLLLAFFGLPACGIRLPPFAAALCACSVFTTAYLFEIVRAALGTVPPSQREAARALGLRAPATFRLVVLPQVLPVAMPPFVSQLTVTLKETSLASAIAVPEIMFAATGRIYAGQDPLLTIGLAGALYAAINLALGAATRFWRGVPLLRSEHG